MDAAKRKSKARVRSSEKACEEETKKRRRKLRYEKPSKQKKTSSIEGSSYRSGTFYLYFALFESYLVLVCQKYILNWIRNMNKHEL